MSEEQTTPVDSANADQDVQARLVALLESEEEQYAADIARLTNFVVPRYQLKPYFKSYEERESGTDSPASLAMKALHNQTPPIDAVNTHLLQMAPVRWSQRERLVWEYPLYAHKVQHHLKHHVATMHSVISNNASTNQLNVDHAKQGENYSEETQKYQAILALKHQHKMLYLGHRE